RRARRQASHRPLQWHLPVLARQALADPEADVAWMHPGRSWLGRVELCSRQADGRGLPASPPSRTRTQIPRGARRSMTVRASAKPRHLKGVPPIRLGINIDHVATLRNARGGRNPDPVRAAKLAVEAGADNITAHLREDRRHITDEDIARLTAAKLAPLNLEMAVTEEMLSIALDARPHASCLVPERRQEITTEGGLDVASQIAS